MLVDIMTNFDQNADKKDVIVGFMFRLSLLFMVRGPEV